MPSSGWMCWQYMTVYGCVRALVVVVVAVTVAVRDAWLTFRFPGGFVLTATRFPSLGYVRRRL